MNDNEKSEEAEVPEGSEKNAESESEEHFEKEIESLNEQIKTLKDTILRKMADAENLKKRLEKEKNDAISYANSRFAKDLLSVLDNLERVEENSHVLSEKIKSDDALKSFFDGMTLCGKELVSVLKKHKIIQMDTKAGETFDPMRHQAMCEVEDDEYKPGSIIKVFQKGYMYSDRLLRPAMVSVAKKHEKS